MQPGAHNREDFDARWPGIVRLVERAGASGARLIVLPEATVPAYVLGTHPVDPAELARAFDDLAAIARRHASTIVYGGAKIARGRTFNAAICIGPDGRELGFAAKQFLWHFDRRWFAAGDALDPVDTPLGRLGLLVCADGRIPTIAATLVERGATMLVMPTAWVSSGRDPQMLENAQADLMANVRARENGVPFVVANKCGIERESVAYCGKSAVIDAAGNFVARGSERNEEIVYGDVEPAATRRHATRAARDRLTAGAATARAGDTPRARIAFTPARAFADVGRFALAAADADCDLLVARGGAPEGGANVLVVDAEHTNAIVTVRGLRIAVVDDETALDPAGLVGARMSGIDLFVWLSASDDGWTTRFARTRAAEVRAFVIAFEGDSGRAFAVDPDGAVVAGTFGDFRMAAFAYDSARARATTVAPTTDVIEGLRAADAIRGRTPVER